MKKIIAAWVILGLLVGFLGLAWAATTYNCTALTGGASRALDSYSVSNLSDGDRAFVIQPSGTSVYVGYFVYEASATDAENVTTHPYRVRPDDYSSAGVWYEMPGPGYVGNTTIDELTLLERTAQPDDPADGTCVIWLSNGTGEGDDGDLMCIINVSGVTAAATLIDYSGL